jgi:hypothetical protein
MSWKRALAMLLIYSSASIAAEEVTAPELAKINDAKRWQTINAICDTSLEGGKTVVRLRPTGQAKTPSDVAVALVEGVKFTEGTLEIDLKGKGPYEASFLGLAFNVVDGKTFEAVYFRPFNFVRDGASEGQTFRSHAIQYVAWPDHTWEKLRKGNPGVYESTVNPVPDPSGWFHVRIEVTKLKVKVWVNDGKQPCLVVDRLGSHDKGKVGLWVDSKEGSFRSLRIAQSN